MKKLCILTDQSILSGKAETGIGELCDSLAYSLNSTYDVTVITIKGYKNKSTTPPMF